MPWDWIILGIVAALALGFVIWKIVTLVKMPKEQRKQVIKDWIISAVVLAEDAFDESGMGEQKMQTVLEKFAKKAPITCKILLKITKDLKLEDIVDEALSMIKKNFEK